MTGESDSDSIVHFILVGHSKEHVLKAIDEFHITKMVMITTNDVIDQSRQFLASLSGLGVELCDIIEVDPFQENSLQDITSKLLDACDKYGQNGKTEIIAGLTGGTNIMAIALGNVSMIKRLRCHYIVSPPDPRVLRFDLYRGIDPNSSMAQIESMFKGDGH